MSYSDYIAALIHKALYLDITENPKSMVGDIGNIKLDLHENGSYLMSTKKQFIVQDISNKIYKVTVEEVKNASEKA